MKNKSDEVWSCSSSLENDLRKYAMDAHNNKSFINVRKCTILFFFLETVIKFVIPI